MPARFALAACALALLFVAGCGPAKLKVSQTLNLDAGDIKSIDPPAQPKPQKITIEFASSAGEVSVYVLKEADAKGDTGLINAEANKEKALASKRGTNETFTVDVPENTAVRVIFVAGKKTDVTVKVTN